MAESFAAALRSARESRRLSLRKLAELVPCSHSYLSELEAGVKTPSPEFAGQLDAVLQAGGRLTQRADPGSAISVRSHKFIVGHIDPVNVPAFVASVGAAEENCLVTRRWAALVKNDHGVCTVHVWDHGVVIHHLIEEATWPTLSELALWRYSSYERDLSWAVTRNAQAAGGPAEPAYVFSCYSLLESAWSAGRLDTALRLMCIPRTLVGKPPRPPAPGIEARLLRDSLPSPDLVPFGVPGSSIGYASWSGVAHYAIDESRAVTEAEMIEVELAVQALWAYCDWLNRRVQTESIPLAPESHTWRWLRGAQSRLGAPRALEPGPHRAMRNAIIGTSGLPAMLESAITILREPA